MKVQLVLEGAEMPKKADKDSAGYDLVVCEDFKVKKGRNIVPTGLKIDIDKGWEGCIRPRSGYSVKGVEGYWDNSESPSRMDADVLIGTIDTGYRGLVGIILYSREEYPFTIRKGTHLAQILFSKCFMDELEQVEDMDDNTERGTGGFGHSTDKK